MQSNNEMTPDDHAVYHLFRKGRQLLNFTSLSIAN
jgi:hypothetical protein